MSPGNHRGIIWSLQGDHEFFSNVVGLPHWQSNYPCWECDASLKEEAKRHGKWVKEIEQEKQNFVRVTSKEARRNPRSAHPLFTLDGVTTRLVRGDGLHILFTKGVYAHLLGSVLHFFCWWDKPGTVQKKTTAERLGLLWTAIQKEYTAQQVSTRVTNLKLSMFTNPKTPWVVTPFLECKGGENKHLLKPLATVAGRLLDRTGPVQCSIMSAMECMSDLIDLFDEADMFLRSNDYDQACRLAKGFLDSYSFLNKWDLEQGHPGFRIVMKFHTMQHLVENSRQPTCSLVLRFGGLCRKSQSLGKVCSSRSSLNETESQMHAEV